MSRLANYLFRFCSAASLLLCVAACVLWARSHLGQQALWESREWRVYADRGRVVGMRGYESPRAHPLWGRDVPDDHRVLGFRAGVLSLEWAGEDGALVASLTSWWSAPLWPALPLSAVLPAVWARRRRLARDRAAGGLCAACDYDLRASRGRCPECGAAAAVQG